MKNKLWIMIGAIVLVALLTNNTPQCFTVLDYQEAYKSPSDIATHKILILVNSDIYDAGINEDDTLKQYIANLEAEGYFVTLTRVKSTSSTTPQELKDYIKQVYAREGIEGCLFIGNLPIAWFEIPDDYNLWYSVFPSDLFYMDLDGTW